MKSQKDNYKKIWKENNLSYNLTLFGTKNYTSSDNFTDENKKSLFKKYSPLTIFNSNEMKEMEIVTEYIFIPTLLKLRQNLDKQQLQQAVDESLIIGCSGSSLEVTLYWGFCPPSKISQVYSALLSKENIEVCSLTDLYPIGNIFFSLW